MKNKFLSMRFKIIVTFLLSIVLAVISANAILGIVYILYISDIFSGLFNYIEETFGIVTIVILLSIPLSILFFFILTQKSLNYLEELSEALRRISLGNLDTRVLVKTSDEMGALAVNINLMVSKLQKSAEDKKYTEELKNELLTNIFHDLKTPLTSIIGYLGLITGRKFDDADELEHYTSIAYQKSIKLKGIIDELFELMYIGSGDIKLSTSKINLTELLQQLCEEYYPILQDAKMECRLNISDKIISIVADGGMLARVFDNLIANAVRYARDGKYIDIAVDRDKEMAIVKVISYGNQIPEKDIPYVFNKFFRVERSRSEVTGGTGLGLAIARKIVELHGGNITVKSDSHKTIFQVELNAV